MTTHDSDSRYSESEARARVAVLYLPLLGIVMDTIPQLHSHMQDSHDTLNHIGILEDYQGPQSSKTYLHIRDAIQQNYEHLNFLGVTTTTISSDVAYAISGSRLYSFSPEPSKNKSTLSSENTRHLLSCFAWTLKNLDKSVLHRFVYTSSAYELKRAVKQ